jgi:putative SOS response-associated peptidase YedK
MARVHDRMPAILSPDAFAMWLDNDGVEADIATALLRPAPEPALELIPIGPAVNRTANDDAAVQAPVGEAIRAAPPEKAR